MRTSELSRLNTKLVCPYNQMKDPSAFKCQWCGNTIPSMTITEIIEMMKVYMLWKGYNSIQYVVRGTGISRQSIYNYRRMTPDKLSSISYTNAQAIHRFIHQELKTMTADEILEFREMYNTRPHFKQTKYSFVPDNVPDDFRLPKIKKDNHPIF